MNFSILTQLGTTFFGGKEEWGGERGPKRAAEIDPYLSIHVIVSALKSLLQK